MIVMSTLLLRLAAPLQAWGDESKYEIRQTGRMPSKSGVIGLLAAALGLRRDNPEVQTLNAALRMGVRIDMPGRVIMDFHTARAPKYNSRGEVRHNKDLSIIMEDSPYVTYRYYLSDACFLVGMESDDDALLTRLSEALAKPCFPLYLGRRACPPTLPLLLGTRGLSLRDALAQEPWLAPDWYRRRNPAAQLRAFLETPRDGIAVRTVRDAPVSFSPVHRRYGPRGLERELVIRVGDDRHDPMREL